MTQATDPMGFVTTYTPDSYGRLSTVKDHKNRATTYTYDAFGRQTTVKYPDGTSSTTVFSWTAGGTNGLYCISSSATGQPSATVYYDALGRETRSGKQLYNGSYLNSDKLYDSYGRLQKTSMPFTASPTLWNTCTYYDDVFDRLKSVTEASGKVSSYIYSGNSVTSTVDNIATTRTYDNSGQLIQATDPGGTIKYTLRPDGQPSAITVGTITTTFGYDKYGRKISQKDPSVGNISYSYDAAGNLSSHEEAGNWEAPEFQYDKYNRPNYFSQSWGGTTYKYNSDGLLESKTTGNGTTVSYQYDAYSRPYIVTENAPDGKFLKKTYTYSGGNLSQLRYDNNNGFIGYESYGYQNGTLYRIMWYPSSGASASIWELKGINGMGQPTSISSGSIARTYQYDSYGNMSYRMSSAASQIQRFYYNYNYATGNLNSRSDLLRNTTENFTYDNLNRLKTFNGGTAVYDNNGNLTGRTDVGPRFYYQSADKPYAIASISATSGEDVPMRNQQIEYIAMGKPLTISENGYTATFTYNSDGERVKMSLVKNGQKELNRYYLGGNYEIDDRKVGGLKEKLYICGDFYTAPAVAVKDGSSGWVLYYIFRDNLGSITHITNASGSLVQENSFDAWGRQRDPATLAVYAPGSEPELFLGRGYTGHEHLPWFALVNMNARLYDPAVGRFLSPDPYVQNPLFSQNYNRYSYVLNNPLRYTDPTG
ncbi:MAG: hypothetical protein LBR64_07560, partial [Dysgonamonadaceae bacterium]|nr:hypothetical protein [Dysgonamonadaceae bacterium]